MNPLDPYLAAFEKLDAAGVSRAPAWLAALRKGGLARFADLGFPTPKQEDWRFTNLAPVTELVPHFEPAAAAVDATALHRLSFDGLEAWRLVFVNGRFAPEHSVAPGPGPVKLANLQSVLAHDGRLLEQHLGRHAAASQNPFVALNQALFQDGAYLEVPESVVLDRPVLLLFVSAALQDGATVMPRNYLHLGPRSRATVIEHYASLTDALAFTNAVTELVLEPGAAVEHCKVQREGERALHVATVQAHQQDGSRLLSHSISTGARLARNDIRTVLGGEGADSLFNGLYLVAGGQLVDHHTVMDHVRSHCTSHEFYHGILGGHAHGVFNGKIYVRPNAQKTDAKQTNKNILLTEEAGVHTKPQLEIFADDVKCTHGATVGQLDDQAVFYLQARGIGEALARQMLLQAFAQGVLDRITVPGVRTDLEHHLFERLHGPGLLGGR